MVRPITWRNVDAPDFAVASDLLTRAGQQAQSVVSGLQDMVGDVQERRDSNRALQIANNTRDARSALLQQFQNDPLALDEAIRTGAVDQQLQQYGGLVDRNQFTPEALQSLRNNLIESANQRQSFQDRLHERELRPAREAMAAAIASGDSKRAREIAEQYDLGAEYELQALTGAEDRRDTLNLRARRDNEFEANQRVRSTLNEFVADTNRLVQDQRATVERVTAEAEAAGLTDYLFNGADASKLRTPQLKELERLNSELQAVQQPVDYDSRRRAFLSDVKPYLKHTTASVPELMQAFDTGWTGVMGIDPITQANAQRAIGEYEKFQEESSNVFVKNDHLGADAITELATEDVKKRFKWDDDNAGAHISNLLLQTVPVTGPDGTRVQIPMTPGIITHVMSRAHEWALKADSPDDVLDTLLGTPEFNDFIQREYEELLSIKQPAELAKQSLYGTAITNAPKGLGPEWTARGFQDQVNVRLAKEAEAKRDRFAGRKGQQEASAQSAAELRRAQQEQTPPYSAEAPSALFTSLRRRIDDASSRADLSSLRSQLRKARQSGLSEEEITRLSKQLEKAAADL